MHKALIKKLKQAISEQMTGHNVTIGPDYEVLDSDNGGFLSILMDVKIAAFSGDDGDYDPDPITMQFDFLPDDDEWALAVGSWGDDWIDITRANLFIVMYYQSQLPIAQQQEAEPVGDIDADDDGHFVDLYPDRTFKLEHKARYHPPKPAAQPAADFRPVLEALLRYAEQRTCWHEETHRGGAIWEICDACGAKWADDEGGKPEWVEPVELENARALLASTEALPQVPEGLARQFHEVYERLAPKFGYETREDTKQFDPLSNNGRLMMAVCAEIITAAKEEGK